MKIGFIGYFTNINKLTDKLFNENKVSVSGIFTSKKYTINKPLIEFDTPSELIEMSDVIYIGEDEASFEIAREAIKNSKHLYFDSPYILTKSEFEELFKLSHETDCLIKFNHSILQKQIYQHLKDSLTPSILKMRASLNASRNQKKLIKSLLFDFILLTRDNIKSGVRKTYFHPVNSKNGIPLSFSIGIVFDNGSTSELLFTQLTEKKQFTLESLQKSENLHLDFELNKATETLQNGRSIEKKDYKKVNNQNKLVKDLTQFVKDIENKKNKPLTIREENHYLMSFTYELLSYMDHES